MAKINWNQGVGSGHGKAKAQTPGKKRLKPSVVRPKLKPSDKGFGNG